MDYLDRYVEQLIPQIKECNTMYFCAFIHEYRDAVMVANKLRRMKYKVEVSVMSVGINHTTQLKIKLK